LPNQAALFRKHTSHLKAGLCKRRTERKGRQSNPKWEYADEGAPPVKGRASRQEPKPEKTKQGLSAAKK